MGIQSRQIGVLGKNDLTRPGILLEIFRDRVLRLIHVHGENHELVLEITRDAVYGFLILPAMRAPCGPKLYKYGLPP